MTPTICCFVLFEGGARPRLQSIPLELAIPTAHVLSPEVPADVEYITARWRGASSAEDRYLEIAGSPEGGNADRLFSAMWDAADLEQRIRETERVCSSIAKAFLGLWDVETQIHTLDVFLFDDFEETIPTQRVRPDELPTVFRQLFVVPDFFKLGGFPYARIMLTRR